MRWLAVLLAIIDTRIYSCCLAAPYPKILVVILSLQSPDEFDSAVFLFLNISPQRNPLNFGFGSTDSIDQKENPPLLGHLAIITQ